MRCKWIVMGIVLLGLIAGPSCFADTTIQSARFSASQDLGTTTVSWEITVKPGEGGNFNIQLFLKDLDHPGQYAAVNPGIGTVLSLFPDNDNRGSFSVRLPVGHYGDGRAILFVAGTNYATALPDLETSGLDIVVKTVQVRVTAEEIEANSAAVQEGGDNKEHIPFVVKEPAGTVLVPGGGYWAMVKGTGGFDQVWIDSKKFRPSGDPNDDYMVFDGEFTVPIPAHPGLYGLNVGLFDTGWKQLSWLYPGVEYEFGNWVVKASPDHYPAVADAFGKRAGIFAIGGNFGNAIATIGSADNTSADYFRLLRSRGMTFLRTNYDPDSYLRSSLYREKVDQIVQNQLEARLAPILAPQDLPSASQGKDQLTQLIAVDSMVASAYKGMPVAIDILNEPHGYKTWSAWKRDATAVLQAVRAVNPQAVTIVGFEGYSEDGREAAKDPIDPGLVTFYALHSYHASAAELPARIGNLSNVLLEEWHNGDPDFAQAIQSTHFAGESAWAWTTPGQDSIPLIKSVDGAVLTFTEDGAAIDSWQHSWAKGELVGQSAAAPTKNTP